MSTRLLMRKKCIFQKCFCTKNQAKFWCFCGYYVSKIFSRCILLFLLQCLDVSCNTFLTAQIKLFSLFIKTIANAVTGYIMSTTNTVHHVRRSSVQVSSKHIRQHVNNIFCFHLKYLPYFRNIAKYVSSANKILTRILGKLCLHTFN